MIGKKLEHKRFGRGTVEGLRHKGLELCVRFEDGLSRWVRVEDVRFLSPVPVIETRRPPKPSLAPEALRVRSMIEAFRLGIVPYGMVEDFTFGRDREISEIKNWLNRTDVGTLAVIGEYGSGKTHLLEYIYALGLKEGFAVSIAELDPNEAPPFKPKAIYRKIVQSFRYREEGEERDFRGFLRAVAKQGRDSLRNHPYLSHILIKIGTREETEWLWNWIEGKESFYWPVLYDHGTAANIYCNILCGLGWAAGAILKLKGHIIILDEAETVDPGWYYRYQVIKGFNLFHGLALLASNDIDLRNERIVQDYTAGIGTWFGDKTGLIYHGRSRHSYVFRYPSYLKVAFAFTPMYVVDELKKLQLKMDCLTLEPLPERSLKEIFEHICLIYDSSYKFLESELDVNRCFKHVLKKAEKKTRAFIKGSVEILDLRRFYPDQELGRFE